MCIHRRKTNTRAELPRDQPKPGGREVTQAGKLEDIIPNKHLQPVNMWMEQSLPPQPTKAKKREKTGGKHEEKSDNTLEDVPSLMPEIELEPLKERDQRVTDSQLL